MEILFWVGAGALLGWMSYAFLGYNEARGVAVSVLMFAVGTAVACLVLGNVLYRRWDI